MLGKGMNRPTLREAAQSASTGSPPCHRDGNRPPGSPVPHRDGNRPPGSPVPHRDGNRQDGGWSHQDGGWSHQDGKWTHQDAKNAKKEEKKVSLKIGLPGLRWCGRLLVVRHSKFALVKLFLNLSSLSLPLRSLRLCGLLTHYF
jgi:hypothetical protein